MVIGGADAIFSIAEEGVSSFFSKLGEKTFSRKEVPISDLPVFEQLLSAGIVMPSLKGRSSAKRRKVYLCSASLPALQVADGYEPVDSADAADLVVLHRSFGSLDEFLKISEYGKLSKAHLFLDSAYHHVVSLGPLVFPGDSACLSCLVGRLAYRWEDVSPPDAPKADSDFGGLLSSFLDCELRAFLARDDSFLVNKTLAIDFQDRSMKHNKLLRVPDCHYCAIHSRSDPQAADHHKLFAS